MKKLIIPIVSCSLIACGGGDSTQTPPVETPTVVETPNIINADNAVNLVKEHFRSVVNSGLLPLPKAVDLMLNSDFISQEDVTCDISGSLSQTVVFQREPNGGFIYEDDELSFVFDECSNEEDFYFSGTSSLRYDFYKNDNDLTYGNIGAKNYQLEMNFYDVFQKDSIFEKQVDGYAEYNRFTQLGLDEIQIYADYQIQDNLFGDKVFKGMIFNYVEDENTQLRTELISGEVKIDSFELAGTMSTEEGLVRGINRYGYYESGKLRLDYGDMYAILIILSDDTVDINIYNEEDEQVDFIIRVPQSRVFSRLD